ncbi:MAG TPA: tetratricopeptide repeat protein [Bacteroidia bacterium]|nr:tetratricopeptide repeat protein [Bacteroidia bacterium]
MIVIFRSFLVLACGAFCITACKNHNGDVKQQGQHKDSAAHAVVIDTITPKILVYSQRITSNPKDADAYWNRGKLEVAQKNINAAYDDFIKALNIDSTKADYYFNLADVDFVRGKTRDAKQLFEKCILLNPKHTEALLKLGEIYFYVKKYSEAISYLDKALKTNPYSGKAYFMKGMIFLETGDTTKALSSMQTAVEQDTKYYDAYIELGLLYARKGNARALDYYNDAINIEPNNLEPYYDKGIFYQFGSDFNDAIGAYKQVLSIDSTYKFALYNLGVVYYIGPKDYKQAIYYFTKTVQRDTAYVLAYYGRANCYAELGEYDKSMADYSHVLSLKPNFKQAQDEYNEVKRKAHK